jgi:hypothetical protein
MFSSTREANFRSISPRPLGPKAAQAGNAFLAAATAKSTSTDVPLEISPRNEPSTGEVLVKVSGEETLCPPM